MKGSIEDLQHRIGYVFLDLDLLQRALTHRSYSHEHKTTDNERLEFLGDAVLQLAASTMLTKRFPDAREGQLSRLRSRLVNATALAAIARSLELGDLLRLGVGENDAGGRERDGILADATEALLGAIYLDGTYVEAAAIAESWMRDRLKIFDDRKVDLHWKDPKSRLQEVLQAKRLGTPSYHTTAKEGLVHQPLYTVEVRLGDKTLAAGQGPSTKKASKAAAEAALATMGETPS